MIRGHSFNTFAKFPKISRMCEYQWVRNISFLEHFANVLNE